VSALKDHPLTRQRVRDAILSRAPDKAIAGGKVALALQIDAILDAWMATADDQAAGGNVFAYAHKKSPNRLLHMPLAPEIPNLSSDHQLFIAGRSMRDVEPSVTLKVKDPDGKTIANADDV